MRCFRIPALCAALVVVMAASRAAQGQSGDAPELTPPAIKSAVTVQIAAPPQEVAVLLEITVDESGRVTSAEVVESGGQDYDQAALEAIRKFEFEPARRAGQPVSARLRYRYVFSPAPEPAPAPLPAPVKAELRADAASVNPPLTRSDTAPVPTRNTSVSGETSDFSEASFGAVARVDAPAREATRRSLEAEDLVRVPGTRGDPLRAIEVLPGVARPSPRDFGSPVLRGSANNESQVLIEDANTPLLYHFGNLTSVFSPRLLERVDVYPGNFSPRFGRATGGIVDVQVRSPRSDRWHGFLELSVLDSSLLVEAPLGPHTALAVGGRRSNIDFFFSNVVPKDAYSVLAAPVYWDYQAVLEHRFGKDHVLRVMPYGSRDQLQLFLAKPEEDDPSLRGNVSGALEFHRLNLELKSRLGARVDQKAQLTIGLSDLQQVFGVDRQDLKTFDAYTRLEWSFLFSPALRWTVGLDAAQQYAKGSFEGGRPTQTEGDPAVEESEDDRERIGLQANQGYLSSAAYTELAIRPLPQWLLLPGVRLERFGEVRSSVFTDIPATGTDRPFRHGVVDPRFSTRYELSDKTTLKAGVGLYSQTAEFWQSLAVVGNPSLEPYRAWQTSAGFEQKLLGTLKLSVEGFYKWLYHRPVRTAQLEAPYFINDGEGRVVGAELLLQGRPDPETGLFLAYTLPRSERKDRQDPWRLFDRDQTHILSLAATRQLGRGWEVGARFRLVTGNPETPIVGSVYEATHDRYVPLFGAVNSVRTPVFHQLDLRVEKRWVIGSFKLFAYLDLLNAYNAEHREGVRYSYDYRKSGPISGTPLMPNLGLRGEL